MLKKQFSKSKPTCKVTFSLPKEAVAKGKTVELVGEWNDWNQKKAIKLKSSRGNYQATVELKTGRNYEFRYLIGKAKWENDWHADGYVPNPFGFDNSVVSIVNLPTLNKGGKKASTATKATAKKSTTKSATAKKATAKKATAKKASTKKATAKTTRKITRKPASKKAATAKKSSKDDLKRIEGIGPKIAEHLNKGGIHTFANLGSASQTKLKAILTAAGPRYKMHNPGSWPKQAKLAAKGKWADLQKLQDQLNGGK